MISIDANQCSTNVIVTTDNLTVLQVLFPIGVKVYGDIGFEAVVGPEDDVQEIIDEYIYSMFGEFTQTFQDDLDQVYSKQHC